MKEKLVQEVFANISELKERIAKSQMFEITANYFDEEGNIKTERMDILKFLNVVGKQKEMGLWSLTSKNYENYVVAHQGSLSSLQNEMEKLLIEIDKIPLLIINKQEKKKVSDKGKKKKKPSKKIEEESHEETSDDSEQEELAEGTLDEDAEMSEEEKEEKKQLNEIWEG